MTGLDETDYRILETLDTYGPLSASELSRILDISRSWAWKRLRKLERLGLVRTIKRGRLLVATPTGASYKAILRIGILRASEYPYILPLRRLLLNISDRVDVVVYDEAYKLALDLAAGKVHLAMAPLVTLAALHRLTAGRVHIIGGGSGGGSGIVYAASPTGRGHATTMASTMELCAEVKRLPGPRVYMGSGDSILESVAQGTLEAGVVWEPYLTQAREMGLYVEECGLPFCCVLGANRSLEAEYARIGRLMSRAVSEASLSRVDLAAYSSLLGFDRRLVEATVGSYKFLEEPPIAEARRLLDYIRSTIVPDRVISDAFRVGP
ncbi:MAG: winged helix-turn-helix transcriptional regulator [Desulfurococcales archaeon]|nr:winged helix-turn-helix transcriptional regulator [Desulfurococcales archaeon]